MRERERNIELKRDEAIICDYRRLPGRERKRDEATISYYQLL